MRQARVELKEANKYIESVHRHHDPVRGHRFSVGAQSKDGKTLHGVAIVGRPVARNTDQKYVAEVTRLCTDGTKNACSFLYQVAARVAKELGFTRIQTFILEEESGGSLVAAGWTRGHTTTGGDWNCSVRKGRKTNQPMGPKVLYFRNLEA